MDLEILRADPAGNITIFVLNMENCTPEQRMAAAKALLADPALKAEQIGFVVSQAGGGGLRRLEMMGGEFCGNAARSFGLLTAREQGLKGKHTVQIAISGAAKPVPVNVDTEEETAEAIIRGPMAEEVLDYKGRHLPVYVFDGITHIIADDLEPPSADMVFSLMKCYEEQSCLTVAGPGAAFGVMFYDTEKGFMKPAVYVRDTDSLVFESSCGSGSAAFGAWAARDLSDGERHFELQQPGGLIEVRVAKQGGRIGQISIGGKVSLGPRLTAQI
jgi:diaminopimelate epimerase